MGDDTSLGRTLLERGLLTRDEFDDAEAERRSTGRPLVGILVEKAYLSAAQIRDALNALQNRVRFCARCNLRVPVPEVVDGRERCPRCLFEVRWQEEKRIAQLQDFESLVQLTRDELPAEVVAARRLSGSHFGKYILVSELGRGGAGVVQKAWDSMLGEYVALKFIREAGGRREHETEVRRAQVLDLLQEARATLKLRHDHIVRVRDIGRIDGQFFIAMDYVEGETLAEHFKQARLRGAVSPLYETPALWLRHLREVAGALHYAHTFPQPIVHCDIKPANILIGATGVAYVLDFGLARVLGSPTEGVERVRGTPAYMAPEQVVGDPAGIGVRTDVYGLGATLYELLAGRPVFTGEPIDILRHGMRDTPQRPLDAAREERATPPPAGPGFLSELTLLEEVCLRCLAKEPRDRYATARDVAEALQRVVEAVEAGRDGGMVPPALAEAIERAEVRRVDEQITNGDLDEALRELHTVRLKRESLTARRRLADRRHQLFLLGQMRVRLIERLNAVRPVLPRLEAGGEVWRDVEVLKATPRQLIVYHESRGREIPWTALAPSQVVELVERAEMREPADRLALAILCRHARFDAKAEACFEGLRGTALEDLAREIRDASA
jgi:serine/threonine protein kinase